MNKLFIIIMLLPCIAFSQSSTFQANSEHTGVYTTENYKTFDKLQWRFKTDGKIFSSPVISNKTAYIGSEDGSFYAVNTETGKQLWKFSTSGAVSSSAAVYKNIVSFGSFDGYYYALNAQTGAVLWKFKTGGEKRVGAKGLWTMQPKDEYMKDLYDFFLSSPIFSDNGETVYFGSSDGNVYALKVETGELQWTFKTNGIIHTTPALYNGKIYIGSWDTYFYAIDAITGQLSWKFKTGEHPEVHVLEGIQASATCSDGMVYFGSRDGFFYALNANSGSLQWKYAANNSWVLTTAAVKKGTVYLGTSDTYLFLAFDAKSGTQQFAQKANGYVYSSPALAANTAFFGDFTGRLFAVDLSSGKLNGTFELDGRKQNAAKVLNKGLLDFGYLMKGKNNALYSTSVEVMDKFYTLGSIVSSPAISNGVIYFGSADGYLYALKLK